MTFPWSLAFGIIIRIRIAVSPPDITPPIPKIVIKLVRFVRVRIIYVARGISEVINQDFLWCKL